MTRKSTAEWIIIYKFLFMEVMEIDYSIIHDSFFIYFILFCSTT